MHIIYRLTSIPSTNPSPVLQMDKNKLNEICLKSVVNAFKDINPKIIFLFDNADQEMYKVVEDVVSFDYEIVASQAGINQTMLNSYAIASRLDDEEPVIFQECDYLYQDQQIGKLYEQAIKELGFVSPYDHLNFYFDKTLHSDVAKIHLVKFHHFRTTERNTMSWGTMARLVRENRDILDRHGYLDGQVWYDLKERGYDLWVPIPSFATHMVERYLSPGINWESVWTPLM